MLEHVLSEELEALIAAKLGNPTHDPHGDPIPTADLELPRSRTASAGRRSSRARRGALVRVSRRRSGDAALPGRARDRAGRRAARSWTSSRSAARCSSRFGGAVHVLGGTARRRDARARRREPAADAEAAAARRRRPCRAAQSAAARRSARAARVRGARRAARARRSSPPSPTSTRATSPPTSPAAPSTATCCVWVIVAANLMAMLVQYLSAKTGIATGRNLPGAVPRALPAPGHFGPVGAGGGDRDRDRPRRVRRRGDRAQPAVRRAAVRRRPDHRRRRVRDPRAADARLPPLRAGDRRACSGSSSSASSTTCCRSASTAAAFAAGLIPHFDGTDSVLLAVGILGATVMPHVVYLHSALTCAAHHAAERRASGASCCASSASTSCSPWASPGFINMTMLVVAAAAVPRLAAAPAWTRSRARTPASTRCSAAARRSPSRSRCWPPACRARASARSPARS